MSDPLEKIYQEIFADAIEYMKEHEVQAVAAPYMAIGALIIEGYCCMNWGTRSSAAV